MTKQWLQIKRLKMKRRGRKAMFSKASGPDKNALYFNDSGKSTSMSIGARSAAAKVLPDARLDRMFPGQPELHPSRPDELKKALGKGHPRAVVIGTLMQGTLRMQKPIKFVHKDLLTTGTVHLRIYMGNDIAFFVRETIVGELRTTRRSIEYGRLGTQSGLERAMYNFKNGSVTWLAPVREIINSGG